MTRPAEPPVPPHDALIAGLAVQADKLAVAAADLRESYRFSRQLKVILAIGVAVIIGMGVMLGLLLNLAASNHENGTVIRDCITPTGKCYQRSQDATARAIAEIVAAIDAHTDLLFLTAVECSHHPLSDAAFATCLHAKGVTTP